MKRVLIGLGIAGALLLLGGVWFFRSIQKSSAAHGDYHECQMNRQELDAARYWYALDNGMTNAPALGKEVLLPYVEDSKAFACPGGGRYSVDPKNLHVVCSIPEHMFDSCLGNSAPHLEPESWMQEYLLDYRSSDTWWYRRSDTPDGGTLRMSGATIVFRGLHGWGGGWGTMEVAGSGTSHGSSGSGDKVVTDSYADGKYTCNIAGHVVRVTEHGRTLQVDTNTFDLSRTRPIVIVDTNGVVQIEVAGEAANQTVQRTGASRFAQRQKERHRRLAPVADLSSEVIRQAEVGNV